MNKIFNNRTAAAFAVMVLAAGCGKSFLDPSIDRDHTPETMETARGTIWDFANAMYVPMEYGLSTLSGNLFAPATDEAQQTVATMDVLTFTQGTISPTNNPLTTRYHYNYEGIRAANFFLDYVADGKGEELLALNRNLITDKINYERDLRYLGYTRAEAHVLKAYYYGELIKMFGGVPIVETIYRDNPDKKYARSSYETVVAYIVDAIDANIDDMAADWSEDAGRTGRFTQDVARAIKSRVLLYAASPRDNPSKDVSKWADAAAAADDIIKLEKYTLDPDYGAYFKGVRTVQSAETILAVSKSASNNPEALNYPIGTTGGASGVTPSHSLVKAYERLTGVTPDPDDPYYGKDPRLAASVVVQGSQWNGRTIDQTKGDDDMSKPHRSRTGYYLKKFLQENLNLTRGETALHNWPVFRYAEILLNFAEAANEQDGPKCAGYTLTPLEALRMVRARASSNLPEISDGVTQDEFRDLVKHERRIELAFEGHRFWDLLRWKDAEAVLNQPVTGVKILNATSYSFNIEEQVVAVRRFDASKNYYMPFPRSEIVGSGGLMKQNDGYE